MTRTEYNSRQRSHRLRRYAERHNDIDNPIPHGTVNGYNNYACRCWACTDARRSYFAAREAS